jgi:hypothetical protein
MERLKLAIEILGHDNNMIPLSMTEWSQDKGTNYDALNYKY